MSLCRTHFEEDVHRKIRESLRQSGLFARGARVALGLDGKIGGIVLAFFLKGLFIRRRDIDLLAVIIDDGREGNGTPAEAIDAAKMLEISYTIRKLPSQSGAASENPARPCPAMKVEQLFAGAEELGAGILATGHNLDDEAVEAFVNFLRGGPNGLSRDESGTGKQGKIPWIKPLRRVPEREVRLYALGHGLYRSRNHERPPEDNMIRAAKRQLNDFDSRHPGTKYSLLRSLEKLEACRGGAILTAKPLSDDAK
ncbi:Uncharacterised protein [uncultured archaeon]|nr:Uncharacterised protein [uncultured archaeon]